MEYMVKKNEETDWVLAGLRGNGFLAVRPDEHGHLKPCGDQSCAKDKPLGCKRVHDVWLKSRLQHVQNEGRVVPEPNWARIEGATELSGLVHLTSPSKGKS